MTIKEIEVKSILRKHKKVDSWFISRYGMNLYRGCQHDCAYCDGRAEKYNVNGDFAKEIEVKTNAAQILHRELDPSRRKKPMKSGFIMLGGGVSDSYQAIQKKYQLTHNALKIVSEFGFPAHLLTKSTNVLQDFELIDKINQKNRAIVSMSFSSVDEKLSAIFEPGVPSPQKRLETLTTFKQAGIAAGMFLMPVIPFITDTVEMIEQAVCAAKDAGLDFIILSGMTLKPGRQQDAFFQTLTDHFPDLIPKYRKIYTDDKWGNTSRTYYSALQHRFYSATRNYKIPLRIPPAIYNDFLDENDRVIVILEHLDYLSQLAGKSSPYGYAAYNISKISIPLSQWEGELKSIKGVGEWTEKLIKEIVQTKRCTYYEKLLFGN